MDQAFLEQALELARIRRGFCSPNPSVGAVVVKDGLCLSSGYHWAAGHPHAEVAALKALGDQARGSTVYVTLEPCCHWGRTPPCTQLLIERGVKEVVYGYKDPNPLVSGKGEAELKAEGILCRHVPLEAIDGFYESYARWVRTRRPFVTAKLAVSLDGKIAGPGDKRVTITGASIARFTGENRKRSDALLTTSKTVRTDDPLLTARTSESYVKPLYVIDRDAALPLSARIFGTGASITLFHAEDAPAGRLSELESRGVRLIPMPFSQDGVQLDRVLDQVGKDGCHDLWVEAGGSLFTSLVSEGLLGRAYLYVGMKWLGSEARPAFADSASQNLSQLLGRARECRWSGYGPHGNDALCELVW